MAPAEPGPIKRGRPKEFDTIVSVRLPAALHDALSREAIRRGEDLADILRERLFVSQKGDDRQNVAR